MGGKDSRGGQSGASPGLLFEAEQPPPICFPLYPSGTQDGPSAWQMLRVPTVSRQPSSVRIKESLLPPMGMGMASSSASHPCESERS